MSELVCSSCKTQRAELHPQPSKLMKGQILYLCNQCIEKRYEPRWVIIIVGRTSSSSVLDYIKHRRYCGEDISAKELLT